MDEFLSDPQTQQAAAAFLVQTACAALPDSIKQMCEQVGRSRRHATPRRAACLLACLRCGLPVLGRRVHLLMPPADGRPPTRRPLPCPALLSAGGSGAYCPDRV